jgi:hypothetical protein
MSTIKIYNRFFAFIFGWSCFPLFKPCHFFARVCIRAIVEQHRLFATDFGRMVAIQHLGVFHPFQVSM